MVITAGIVREYIANISISYTLAGNVFKLRVIVAPSFGIKRRRYKKQATEPSVCMGESR